MTDNRPERNSSSATASDHIVQEEKVSALFRSIPLSMAQIDLDFRIRKVRLIDSKFVGLNEDELIGKMLDEVEGESLESRQFFETVVETGLPQQQVRVFRSDGDASERRTYNTLWYPVFADNGDICAVGAITEDISAIEQRERTLKHIARELQHRVKNTLANVIALVEQASRSARTQEDALDILKRRVMALAATHSQLTESNWGPTPLRNILAQEMTRVYGEDAVQLSGPDLVMTAQSALAFSMGLHEMMANAVNYGSLSESGGKVVLDWTINADEGDGGWVHFDWKETGGPSLCKAPPKNGFGNRLIDASLRTSLRGKMERIWEEDGLRYRFALPMALLCGT